MLANFLSDVETKTFGSSELKKKNERDHKSLVILQFSQSYYY